VARFLVVDRDPATRAMLAVALYASGFEIDTAANRAEALRKMELDPPDAVFLGQAGTNADGRAVLNACAEEPTWNDAAIVPIPSAWRDARTVKDLRTEVDEFLTARSLHLL
jgi:DNA-binding response OmpR family regulator